MKQNFKFILVFLFLALTMSFVSADLTDGLKGYWNFDEAAGTNFADSLNDNNLTLTNTSGQITINQLGILGKAITHEKENKTIASYLSNANVTSNLKIAGDISSNVWIKVNSDAPWSMSTNDSILVNIGQNPSGFNRISLFGLYDVNAINSSIYFATYTDSTVSSSLIYENISLRTLLNDNQWHMFTYTRKKSTSTNDIKLYIDGVLITGYNVITENSNTTFPTTSPMYVFNVNTNFSAPPITIDELGIWSKELTSAEVTQLYNSGNGNSYPFNDLTPPTASVGTGTYNNNFSVTLDNNGVADIYYTTDGSDPDDTDTLYSGAISITGTTTLKAISWVSDENKSGISSYTYTMVVADPSITETTDTYNNDFTTTITCATTTASIYYTTNGDTPDTGDTLYTGAITINSTQTLKAKAFQTGYTDSGTDSETYTMVVAGTPTADKDSGLYYDPFNVTLTKTGTTTGTKLTYTLNGDAPTIASAEYSAPLTISANLTLKFAEFKTGYTATSIVTKTYEVREPITNFYFYDENALLPIPTVTITDSNGSIYTANGSGLWTTSLSNIAKSFTISKTGYDTRDLDFYFKRQDANYNFLLNPTGLDSSIGFIVKDSNDNLWNNKYLMFSKKDFNITEIIGNTNADEINSNATNYILFKTFDYTDNSYPLISKVTNQIKRNAASGTASVMIRYTYNDGTNLEVENTSTSSTYATKTYTNTSASKPVKKVEVLLKMSSTSYTTYEKDTKIYFTGYSGNFIINSLLTSSSGTATASLLANGDYNALLYDATGTLVDTYEKTTVTVNKPKNEVTLADISPYDITVGGLLGYSLTNQSASSVSFNIFAGTQGFYYFSVVDYNAVPADRKYIPRQYFTQVPMGTGYEGALTYQPYLLLETDAVVPKITVLDQLNKPIGDVDIFISRSINNVQTIVESGKTTSTGNMSFSAYPLEYYYINVIYNGVDKGTFRVQPRESSDNFIIVIDTSDDVVDTGELIITADFSGTPKVVNIDNTNINADITITQSLNQATSYNLYLIQNNVTKASTSGAISGLVTNIDYDFDSSVVDRFNNNLTLKLVVNYPDGNQTFYYTITATKNAKGLMYFAPQIINDIGQPLGIILAILITGIILATLTFSGLNISPTAITILGVLILGVFMFLGWLDTGITVLGFDIARFFYVLMAIAMIYFMMRGEQYA